MVYPVSPRSHTLRASSPARKWRRMLIEMVKASTRSKVDRLARRAALAKRIADAQVAGTVSIEVDARDCDGSRWQEVCRVPATVTHVEAWDRDRGAHADGIYHWSIA